MIVATPEERNAWQSGLPKSLTLSFSNGTTITDSAIASESAEFELSIANDAQLKFGQCGAGCFKVRLLNTDVEYKGLSVVPTYSVGTYTYRLGSFVVYSDTKTSDNIYRDLVCYDALGEILQTNYSDWHNSLTFPMTVRQYRDAFFQHVGITQESVTLPNDSVTVNNNFVAEMYSGDDLLTSICEINGTFGYLNNNGYFHYVVLNDETVQDGGELDVYVQGSLIYENYEVQPVTQVQIRQTAEDVGGIAGTAGNTYIIQDNPLMYGKSTNELQLIGLRFINAVQHFKYVPLTVDIPAAPWIQIGDFVEFESGSDTVKTLVLHRVMSGITALMDALESKGEEYYSEPVNSTNRSVKILRQKTNELTRTVDENTLKITGLTRTMTTTTEQIALLSQTVDGLESLVEKNVSGFFFNCVPKDNNDGTLTITAHFYLGREEVTKDYPEQCYTWWKKTEDGNEYIGYGYSITVIKNEYGYGGEVEASLLLLVERYPEVSQGRLVFSKNMVAKQLIALQGAIAFSEGYPIISDPNTWDDFYPVFGYDDETMPLEGKEN